MISRHLPMVVSVASVIVLSVSLTIVFVVLAFH
jgi:hypothetical protein